MAMVDSRPPSEGGGGGKVWGLFKLPFRNTGNSTTHTTTSSSSYQTEGSNTHNSNNNRGLSSSNSVSSVARSLLPTRRRLRLDPSNKLYFPSTNSRLYLLHFSDVRGLILMSPTGLIINSMRSSYLLRLIWFTLFAFGLILVWNLWNICFWCETSESDVSSCIMPNYCSFQCITSRTSPVISKILTWHCWFIWYRWSLFFLETLSN